jgi:hypothetical protein
VKLALACALGALAACGGARSDVKRRDDAVVLVQSNVRDAQIFIDGQFITFLHAAGAGIALSPGTHRFELRHDDYFSSYLELTVGRSDRKKVTMNMAQVLP